MAEELNPLSGMRQALWAALVKIGRFLYRRRRVCVYSYPIEQAAKIQVPLARAKDSMPDLLLYVDQDRWQRRETLLATARKRLEQGMHVYTVVGDGRLLHYGWLVESAAKSYMAQVDQVYVFPPHSAYMFDFYTAPPARGRGLYTDSLRQILSQAAAVPQVEKIFIAVMAENVASRRVIEKVGFIHETTLFEHVILGLSRQGRSERTDVRR